MVVYSLLIKDLKPNLTLCTQNCNGNKQTKHLPSSTFTPRTKISEEKAANPRIGYKIQQHKLGDITQEFLEQAIIA